MGRFIVRRLLAAIPLLLGISVTLFVVIQLPPGGPLDIYAGEGTSLSRETRAAIEKQLGLDQPLAIQYLRWISSVLQGDWGISYFEHRKVTALIADRLPASLLLTGVSFLIAVVAAVPLGVFAATKGHRGLRNTVEISSILGISIPTFWLAIVAVLIFAVWLRLLPSSGMYTIGAPFSLSDRIQHIIMPALVASAYWVAAWSRYVKGSMLEVMRQDYVTTARSKGVTETMVLWKHCLKNALIPFITVVGLRMPYFFSGAVVVEIVFSWPGLGQLLYFSVLRHDYPVTMGCFMGVAALVIIGNLIADLMYAVVDPRIRY